MFREQRVSQEQREEGKKVEREEVRGNCHHGGTFRVGSNSG